MKWADWGNMVRTRFIEVHNDDRSGQDAPSGQFVTEMPLGVVTFPGGLGGPFLEPLDMGPVIDTGLGSATNSSAPGRKEYHHTLPALALREVVEDWTTGEVAPTTLHSATGWPV